MSDRALRTLRTLATKRVAALPAALPGPLFALLVALVPATSSAAGDAERGRVVAAVCAPCHGSDGVSPSPAFPILAGQHEIYLAAAIRGYQTGQRPDAVMGGAVRTMSGQQIDDVSAWYASQGRGQNESKGLVKPADREDAQAAAAAATAAAGAEATALEAGEAPAVAADANTGSAKVESSRTAKPAPATLAGCPVDNPNIPAAQDSDRDGLPDRYDAVPADASEFAKDTNGDGWLELCDIRQLQAIQTLGSGNGNATGLDWEARASRRYQIVRDLDASVIPSFQPIGNCGPQNNCMIAGDKFGFTGSLDGGGHVIRRLRIERPETGGVGLFGVLAKPGTIRNIELVDATVTGLHGVGALVGANFGLLENCAGSVRITGKNATGALVGGHAGKVINCSASGEVTGSDAIGGLIGDMRGFVARSHASTRVSGNNGVGGLVGLNTFSTLVSSYSTGTVRGKNNVGGLAGINTDAVVADSYSIAEVEGEGTNAGGLVAFNSQSRIRNSYARGTVRGVTAVGGLVGTNNGSIRASYATGRVQGTSKIGGLVGDKSTGTVIASYWDMKTSGRNFGAGSDDVRDDNEFGPGESSSLAAYGKTTPALRALGADNTRWLPAASTPEAERADYYCDVDADGSVGADEQNPDNMAWDFGTTAELPGLRCITGGRAAQPLR